MADPSHILLALLIAVECIVFYAHTVRFVAPYYPRNFDQTSYYDASYWLAEQIRREGWPALIMRYLHPIDASGITLIVQGGITAFLLGPNRIALLSINLFYFIALQLVLFWSVRRMTRSTALAWMALAFLLATKAILNDAGGLYDYRLDFAALCLYGIWVCLILRSRVFLDLKTSLAAALVAILLVSVRTFTIAYIGLVFGELLLVAVLALLLTRAPEPRKFATERVRNICLSGALTFVFAFPLIYAAREAIYAYYGVTHVVSNEKYIRAAELHLHSLLDHLTFYPRNIAVAQLGLSFGVLTAIALATTLLTGSVPARGFGAERRGDRFAFVALACSIATPIVALTFDISKSPVVGGVTIVPFTLLLVLLVDAAARLRPRFDRRAALPILAGMLVIAATAQFVANGSKSGIHDLADEANISKLNEAIVRYASNSGMERPRISFDRVVDYINLGTVSLYAFERLGHPIDFQPAFGHGDYGIFATPRAVALKLVSESDIVVLTDPLLGRDTPYPINTKIRDYWSDLWRWATKNCVELVSVPIFGIPHHVFVRAQPRPAG